MFQHMDVEKEMELLKRGQAAPDDQAQGKEDQSSKYPRPAQRGSETGKGGALASSSADPAPETEDPLTAATEGTRNSPARGQRQSGWGGQQGARSRRGWGNQGWSGYGRNGRQHDQSFEENVRLIARLCLRHEDELSQMRVERDCVLTMETQEAAVLAQLYRLSTVWKEKKEKGEVDCSLRMALFLGLCKVWVDRLQALQALDATTAEAKALRERIIDPLVVHEVGPLEFLPEQTHGLGAAEAESNHGAPNGDHGPECPATLSLDTPDGLGVRRGDGDFLAVGGTPGSEIGSGLGAAYQPLREFQREGDRAPDARHAHGPPAPGKGGVRAFSPTGDTALGKSGPGGGRSAGSRGSGVQAGGERLVRPDLYGPVLLNHTNVCYVNSCCHLLRWLGLHENPHFSYGRLATAMRSLTCKGRLNLLSLLPWRQAFTGWANLHRQNDAAEFIHFLLGYSQPEAYSGRWEARISNDDSPLGFELRDSGDCYGPLVIDIAGPSLQHCLYHWHIHGQMHALTVPPTFFSFTAAQEIPQRDFRSQQGCLACFHPGWGSGSYSMLSQRSRLLDSHCSVRGERRDFSHWPRPPEWALPCCTE